jgi:hypothetical protein
MIEKVAAASLERGTLTGDEVDHIRLGQPIAKTPHRFATGCAARIVRRKASRDPACLGRPGAA